MMNFTVVGFWYSSGSQRESGVYTQLYRTYDFSSAVQYQSFLQAINLWFRATGRRATGFPKLRAISFKLRREEQQCRCLHQNSNKLLFCHQIFGPFHFVDSTQVFSVGANIVNFYKSMKTTVNIQFSCPYNVKRQATNHLIVNRLAY